MDGLSVHERAARSSDRLRLRGSLTLRVCEQQVIDLGAACRRFSPPNRQMAPLQRAMKQEYDRKLGRSVCVPLLMPRDP